MRSYVKFFAGMGVGVGSLALFLGGIGFVLAMADHETSEIASCLYLFFAGLSSVLFSGMAWTLVEIAEKVAPLPWTR